MMQLDQTQKILRDAIKTIEDMTPEDVAAYKEYAQTMYALGQSQFENGQYEEALNLFRLPLTINPLDFDNLRGCAFCFKQLNQMEEALSCFNALVTLYTFLDLPQDPSLLIAMAEIYIMRQDTERALRALDLAQRSLETGVDQERKPLGEQAQEELKKRIRVLCDTANRKAIH